jgi:amidase
MIEGRKVEYIQAMSYSQWFNLLGNPGAVVPVGKSPEGLPIGVQIVGRHKKDFSVLQMAHAFEQATGYAKKRPSIA